MKTALRANPAAANAFRDSRWRSSLLLLLLVAACFTGGFIHLLSARDGKAPSGLRVTSPAQDPASVPTLTIAPRWLEGQRIIIALDLAPTAWSMEAEPGSWLDVLQLRDHLLKDKDHLLNGKDHGQNPGDYLLKGKDHGLDDLELGLRRLDRGLRDQGTLLGSAKHFPHT